MLWKWPQNSGIVTKYVVSKFQQFALRLPSADVTLRLRPMDCWRFSYFEFFFLLLVFAIGRWDAPFDPPSPSASTFSPSGVFRSVSAISNQYGHTNNRVMTKFVHSHKEHNLLSLAMKCKARRYQSKLKREQHETKLPEIRHYR